MNGILLIHHDKAIRFRLKTLLSARYEVASAKNLVAGIKQMAKTRPDVIVVGYDRVKEEGARLLRYLRDNALKIPVVVVFSAGAGNAQPLLMKLGARAFVEYPVDLERLYQALAGAFDAHGDATAPPPPITPEEMTSNLSVLEARLNRAMKCVGGKNLVYIQSMVLGGATSKPRISLKCPWRAEYGLKRDVYYEFIRDVCCGEPTKCEAVRLFNASRESA